MQTKTNKNGVKLLAAAMVLAVAISGFIIISDDSYAEGEAVTTNVASVDGKEYSTLEEAVTAAKEGSTITILSDISNITSTITIGNSITLDLNKHTINSSSGRIVVTDGNVLIKNGSFKFTGNENTSPVGVSSVKGEKNTTPILVMSNVDIDSTKFGIGIFGIKTAGDGATDDGKKLRDVSIDDKSSFYATLEMNDCSITSTYCAFATNGNYGFESIAVNGGSIKSTGSPAFYIASNAKVTVNECEIEGISGFDQRAGILEINGGSIVYNGPTESKESGDGPVDFGTAIQIVNAKGYSQADVTTTIIGTTIEAGTEKVFGDICFGINRDNGKELTLEEIKNQESYKSTRNMTLTVDGMTFSVEKDAQASISYTTASEVKIGTGTTVDITEDITTSATISCNGTLNISNATVNTTGGFDTNSNGTLNIGTNGVVLANEATNAKSMKFNGTFAHVMVDGKERYSYSDLQYNLDNVTAWEKGNGDEVSKRVYVFGTYTLNNDVVVPSGVDLRVQATKADTMVEEGSAKSNIDLNGYKITFQSGSQVIGKISNGTDSVVFTDLTKSSGFSIESGSIIINGSVVSDTSGDVVISGDAVITGNVKVEGKIVVNSGSTLNIAEGSKVTADKIEINDGTADYTVVNIAGTVNADIEATRSDKTTVTVTPEAKINGTVSDSIKDSVSSATWETVTISGVLDANFVGKQNQVVVVTGDLSIKSTMEINGKLIIEDGATVTLEKGAGITFGPLAAVTIDGKLIINEESTFSISGDACSMVVNGEITINYTGVTIDATTTVNGSIVITEYGAAKFNKVTITKDADLTINGKLAGTVINEGAITIDSEVTSATEFTIQMRDGSSAEISEYNGSIIVNDSGMKYKTGGVEQDMQAVNAAEFTKVTGVKISEEMFVWTEKNVKYAKGIMTVSGTIGAMTDDAGEALADSKVEFISGVVDVADTTFGKVNAYVYAGAEANITGTVTMSEAKFTLKNTTVTGVSAAGKVSLKGTLMTKTVVDTALDLNAANYKAKVGDVEYNYYTTLENAINAGVTAISTYGKIVVEKDLDIPADVKITMREKSTMEISKDATLRFVQGSKLTNASNDITVKGTLIVEDAAKNGITENRITADVDRKSGDSKVYTMTYTNIYDALGNAADGEIVKLRSDKVTVDKDVTVPAGAKLLIDNNKEFVVDRITVTIDGTVDAINGKFTIKESSDDKESKIVLNGLFQCSNSQTYKNVIAGAYFLLDNADSIAPITYAAKNIDTIDGDVTLYNENIVTDITFDYTKGGNVNLIIASGASFKADNVTLKNVVFNATNAKNVDANIILTNGSADFENVKGMVFSDNVTYDSENNATYTAQISGTVAIGTSTTGAYTSGKIVFGGAVEAAGSVNANITVTIPADSTVTVKTAYTINGTIEVIGTLKAEANMTTVVNAVVLGTIETKNSVTITVNTLYLGITKDQIIKETDTGAQATIGKGVKIASNGIAFVAPGSVVDESFTDTYTKKTEFYVDDVIYMTAYVNGTTTTKINDIVASVDNAKFLKWMNGDKAVADTDFIGGDVKKVTAVLDYNICEVNVSAVPGALVYIDGKLYDSEVKYSVGSHTIEIYLDYGYTGTPVVKVNGTTVSGTFTTSADKTTDIIVSGITVVQPGESSGSSSGSNDGMSITDYLLIVLVVLIVIMAVLVAIRMMRS